MPTTKTAPKKTTAKTETAYVAKKRETEGAVTPETLAKLSDAEIDALAARGSTDAEHEPAEAMIKEAAEALVRAGRVFDAVHTDDGSNRTSSFAATWALVHFSRAIAEDLHAREGMMLSVEPHSDELLGMPTIPFGTTVAAQPEELGLYVVGDVRRNGPGVRALVRGHGERHGREMSATVPELQSDAKHCGFEVADDLYHGVFGNLVALSALGHLDLPLTFGPHKLADEV